MVDLLVVIVVIAFFVFDARFRSRLIAGLGAVIGVRPPLSHDDHADGRDDAGDATADDDHADERDALPDAATLDALARLVAAGLVSASQACNVGLGIAQRGNNPVYRALRARADALKRAGGSARDEIVAVTKDGTVIRQDEDGQEYSIDARTRQRRYHRKEQD